jgi:hypothetical protein
MHATDPGDIDASLSFSRVANVRLGAARTILNTQVKVDEVRLKRKSADLLPAILKRLAEEEARLTIEGWMRLFNKEEVLDCWRRFSLIKKIALLRICQPEEQQWIWDYEDGLIQSILDGQATITY